MGLRREDFHHILEACSPGTAFTAHFYATAKSSLGSLLQQANAECIVLTRDARATVVAAISNPRPSEAVVVDFTIGARFDLEQFERAVFTGLESLQKREVSRLPARAAAPRATL